MWAVLWYKYWVVESWVSIWEASATLTLSCTIHNTWCRSGFYLMTQMYVYIVIVFSSIMLYRIPCTCKFWGICVNFVNLMIQTVFFNIGNMLIYSRTKILQKYCLMVFNTLESLWCTSTLEKPQWTWMLGFHWSNNYHISWLTRVRYHTHCFTFYVYKFRVVAIYSRVNGPCCRDKDMLPQILHNQQDWYKYQQR